MNTDATPIARMDTEPVERDDNAEFIVLARNAHVELLAALEEVSAMSQAWMDGDTHTWEMRLRQRGISQWRTTPSPRPPPAC